MLIADFTNVRNTPQLKCFKPIQKLFIRRIWPDIIVGGTSMVSSTSVPDDEQVRVLLVNSANGSSVELLPFVDFNVISEFSAKYEGYQRRAARVSQGNGIPVYQGYDLYSIVLAPEHAVNLSNDKFLAIELRNLNTASSLNTTADKIPRYELWGFEFGRVADFAIKYTPMYLSPTELQKDFSVGDNELVAIPIDLIREIQFYPNQLDGASPIFTTQELVLDQEAANDLTFLPLDQNSNLNLPFYLPSGSNVGNFTFTDIRFGFNRWAILDLSLFRAFTIRRDSSNTAFDFFLLDTKPASVQELIATPAVSPSSPLVE